MLYGSFARVYLLAEWPPLMKGRSFDRVVSSYVLHEFADTTKVELLTHLARQTVAPGGRILIGDILFADARARTEAHAEWRASWDEDEHYAVAAELIRDLEAEGLSAHFEKLSFCGGVLEIQPWDATLLGDPGSHRTL